MKSPTQPKALQAGVHPVPPNGQDPDPGASLVSLGSGVLKEVQVELKARLGRASLSVEELLALKAGSVVKLESKLNDLVELRLNASVVAHGEIVAVGEHFGLRIVNIAKIS
jgi:flagellar motor switch protein FliN